MRIMGDAARGRLKRFLASGLLLQYWLLFCAIPLAHALQSGPDRPAAAHVEQQGDAACPPSHDHLHCQVCQTLRLGASAPHGPAPHWTETFAGSAVSAPQDRAYRARLFTHLGSRAPPQA